jgi:hypothetical protein
MIKAGVYLPESKKGGIAVKVFISWSGSRSKEAALALRNWIPSVFQSVEPWMSETEIRAGAMWLNELMNGLKEARFGIICITPENQLAPWLHFEAGAIAKQVNDQNYVCPYLILLKGTEFQGNPLTYFQYKQADEKGTRELVESINQLIEKPLEKDILYKTFTLWWPELHKSLTHLSEPETKTKVKRSSEDMLEEILELVREMVRTPQSYVNDVNNSLREFLPVAQVTPESINSIIKAISLLPPEEERFLRLVTSGLVAEKRSPKEVAKILGISVKDVSRIQAQALRNLRDILRNMG